MPHQERGPSYGGNDPLIRGWALERVPLDSTRHPESRRPGYIFAYTSRTRMYTYIPQESEQKLRHINFTHTINPILRTNIKYFDTELARWWSQPL